MLKSIARQAKAKIDRSLNKFIAGVFLAVQLFTPLLLVQPVRAANPSDECGNLTFLVKYETDNAGNFNDTIQDDSGQDVVTFSSFDTKDEDGKTEIIGFDWSSTIPVDKVVVVAANDSATQSGNELESGTYPDDFTPEDFDSSQGVSHVTFCYDKDDQTEEAKLTLKKIIPDGNATQGDFTPTVNGEVSIQEQPVAWDSVLNLEPGEYTVDEQTPLVEGYEQDSIECFVTGNEAASVPNPVQLEDGDDVTCVITNSLEKVDEVLGEIQVRKFNDEDNDGNYDESDEELLADWTIRLYQESNGEWDEVEDIKTSANDFVSFEDLELGTYYVCEVNQDGWEQTRPTINNRANNSVINESGEDDEADWCYERVLDEDENPRRATFGNYKDTGDLKVRKFEDDNKNAEFDKEEEEQNGNWDMFLYDENWDPYPNDDDYELNTKDDAWVAYENLPAGTYYVCEETKIKWTQTYPSDENGTFNQSDNHTEGDEEMWCWEREVTAGQSNYVEFGNYEEDDNGGGGGDNGSVIVIKYHDLDEDGVRDDNEPVLPGWTFNLDQMQEVTDETGQAVFSSLRAGKYQLSEEAQSGWTLGNIRCENVNLTINEDSAEVTLPSGDNITCEVGNYQDAELLIEKTNDATDAQVPGTDVEYTITVTNPETSGVIYDAIVQDVLPAGFSHTGPYTVTSSVNGDITGLVTFSGYDSDNVATWELGNLAVGEVVTITYTVEIGENVSPGTYENVAFVTGLDRNEKVVFGDDESPETENDIFAESSVRVAAVLGAVTQPPAVLPVTGTSAGLSLIAGSLISFFGGLMTLSRKQLRALRKFFGRFQQAAGIMTLSIAFVAMSILPAFAGAWTGNGWTFRVAELASTINTDKANLVYSVSTTKDNGPFEVTLDVDGPVDSTQNASLDASGSDYFTLDLSKDGTYDLSVTVSNGGETLGPDVQTIVVDTDGAASGVGGNGSTTANGGIGGNGVVALDSQGVVSDVAATDSNQADDSEGDQQGATDDQTNGDEDENGENGADGEDEGSDLWTNILIVGVIALAGYYAYNWWRIRE